MKLFAKTWILVNLTLEQDIWILKILKTGCPKYLRKEQARFCFVQAGFCGAEHTEPYLFRFHIDMSCLVWACYSEKMTWLTLFLRRVLCWLRKRKSDACAGILGFAEVVSDVACRFHFCGTAQMCHKGLLFWWDS